jgi:hypothetical protein
MIVNKEQVIDWLEHPVTQKYVQKIHEVIHVEDGLTRFNIETMSISELGAATLAIANYIRGMEDAVDFNAIFSEVLNED